MKDVALDPTKDPSNQIHHDANSAMQTLLPALSEACSRLRHHGESKLNWLSIKPCIHFRDAKSVCTFCHPEFPTRYDGRVGNIYMCYAVEDRSKWGPIDKRFVARVLSVSYIDFVEQEKDPNGPYRQENPTIRALPRKVARSIANGFFNGDVEEIQNGADWFFIQILGKEGGNEAPFDGLIVPGL